MKIGSTVTQITSPPIQGVVVEVRWNTQRDTKELLVEYMEAGKLYQRWFLECEVFEAKGV